MQKWLFAGALVALGLLYPILTTPEKERLAVFVDKPSTVHVQPQARVLFGGDMMFDRSVRAAMSAHGGDYIFSCLDETLKSADLVVANLEGPITESPSISLASIPDSPANYIFTFAPQTAALLAAHHMGLVSLGNNHIYNFGEEGIISTEAYLKAAGERYFGEPAVAGEPMGHTVAEEAINGVQLALIGYNEFDPSPSEATGSTTLAQIAQEKSRGFVPVVFAHWGDEYAESAPARIVLLAHKFVEAGAILVVGSHPHVVEQSENYQGVPIYYSLGNLIFDQYFSSAVDHGLLLSVGFTPQGVASLTEIPIVLQPDRRTCVGE